jgi:hypothetical protein
MAALMWQAMPPLARRIVAAQQGSVENWSSSQRNFEFFGGYPANSEEMPVSLDDQRFQEECPEAASAGME